jgi:hypothetical protein
MNFRHELHSKNRSLLLRHSDRTENIVYMFRTASITWQWSLSREILPSSGWSYSCLLSGSSTEPGVCVITLYLTFRAEIV